MAVSSYNEGRTVAEVGPKTWLDGTRFQKIKIILI